MLFVSDGWTFILCKTLIASTAFLIDSSPEAASCGMTWSHIVTEKPPENEGETKRQKYSNSLQFSGPNVELTTLRRANDADEACFLLPAPFEARDHVTISVGVRVE